MGSRYRFTVDITATHKNVSGSCIFVVAHRPDKDIKFIVDCGLYQGEEDCEKKNYEKFSFNPENLDFVLLTHNHVDHTGRIPVLFKNGFYNKVYTTQNTKDMLPIAMENNEKILRLNAKKNNKKPLYTYKDISYFFDNLEAKEFKETFTPAQGVNVTFFKNGHLIGAAVILVQISCDDYEDINLLFSGDYSEKNIFFETEDLPEEVYNMPVHVICESTYGYVDAAEVNKPVFINNLVKWLNDSNIGTILVPSLSLGRFQEIAYRLKCAQEEGIIDKNIPLWFDGNLAIKYTNLYKYKLDIFSHMRDFMPENAVFVEDSIRRKLISNYRNKQIIVATSGMGCYGPTQEYILNFIEKKNVAIHFTSYTSPGTFGNKLLSSEQGQLVTLGPVTKRKLAIVTDTREFSSHAKRDELLRFLKKFKQARTILVNHGEEETKEQFVKYCKSNYVDCKEIMVLNNTVRLNRWEKIKEIC